jgi:hypothetical protein
MTDVTRQKFAALMVEIELLEERVAELQASADAARADAASPLRLELLNSQRQLAEKRTELQRISDGCGRPRVG